MEEHRERRCSEECSQIRSRGEIGAEMDHLDGVEETELAKTSGIDPGREKIHAPWHQRDGRNPLPIAIETAVHLLMVRKL